ncbi:MAG: hypothetical protein JOZ23_16915 [Mycobacterium sp.]|nr:hypothetical protein [Mycobacterium sp.]MBV9353189.1 hypothetical protein [Mycobacterium sp.]
MRRAVLRTQVALATAQILFWTTLIGILVALALRARQRRTGRGRTGSAENQPSGEETGNPV